MSTRSKNRLVRRLIVILIFAVAFVIFWYFLRYLTSEPSPPRDSGATSSPAVLPHAACVILGATSSERGQQDRCFTS